MFLSCGQSVGTDHELEPRARVLARLRPADKRRPSRYRRVMRTRYSLPWLTELMQQVVDDLAASGSQWHLRQVAAGAPVFGTLAMPRVEMISASGGLGPRVWFESEITLRLEWKDSNTEWFGSQKTDFVLADVLYALCSGEYELNPRGYLRIGRREGRRARRIHLG